jgi:hypothetical protein
VPARQQDPLEASWPCLWLSIQTPLPRRQAAVGSWTQLRSLCQINEMGKMTVLSSQSCVEN